MAGYSLKELLAMSAQEAKYGEVQDAAAAKKVELSGMTDSERLLEEMKQDLSAFSEVNAQDTLRTNMTARLLDQVPNEYYRKLQENRARTGEEVQSDMQLKTLNTTVNLFAGTGLVGLDIATKNSLYGDGGFREKVLTPATELLGNYNAWTHEKYSSHKQADEALMAKENAVAAAESQAQYDRDTNEGNEVIAGIKQVGRDLGQSAWNITQHPTAFVDEVVGQLPTLLMGPMAKGLVSNAAVTARASKLALDAEAKAFRAGFKEEIFTADAFKAQAARELQTKAFVGLVGGSEAGSVYGDAAGQIMTMDFEEIRQRFPDHPDIKALENIGPDQVTRADEFQIKQKLASEIGLKAAGMMLPIAAGAARFAAALNLNPLGLSKQGAKQKVGQEILDILGEPIEEGLQGAGGELVKNIARIEAGDDQQRLLTGVGGAAGQGIAVAGGMAGGLRAPGITGDIALASAREVGDYILGRGQRVQEKLDAEGQAAQAEANVQIQASADTLSAGLQAIPEVAGQSLLVPLQADPTIEPVVAAQLQGDTLEPINKVQALSRAIAMFPTLKDEQRAEMGIFAYKIAREIIDNMETMPKELKEAAFRLVNNPVVKNLVAQVQTMPTEVVEELIATLPVGKTPDGIPLNQAESTAFEKIKVLLDVAPDKFTREQTERILAHEDKFTPDQKKQLDLAAKIDDIRVDQEKAAEEIRKQFPNAVGASDVNLMITDTGFDTGSSKKFSLSQYVRRISTFMASGNIQLAKIDMVNLQKFTDHMRRRSDAFDTAAAEHVAKGKKPRDFQTVALGGTITAEGKLDLKTKYKLDVTNEKSLETLSWVFADANTVAETYNLLAKQFPEVIKASQKDQGDQVLDDQADTNLAPTWQKVVSAEEAAAYVAAKKGKKAPAATETKLAEPVVTPAPTEAPKTEPAPTATEEPVAEPTPEPAKLDTKKVANFVLGNSSIRYEFTSEGVKIINVLTKPGKDNENRGKGSAKKALEEFLRLVDELNQPSYLIVAGYSKRLNEKGEDITDASLIKLYSQFGFVLDSASTNQTMRRPQTVPPVVKAAAEPVVEEAPPIVEPVVEETVPGEFKLNSGQRTAFREIFDFLRAKTIMAYALIGSAGTGKTTLINSILDEIRNDPILARRQIILTSPTHRANSVIRSKNPDRKVITLHKLLKLKPFVDLEKFDAKNIQFEQGDSESGIPPGSIIIIDESSMINDDLFSFLMDTAEQAGDVKIIFMGDSAQLGPVKQATDSKALTSTDGKSVLTQVMRAKNAELLGESVFIREEGDFSYRSNINGPNGVKFFDNITSFVKNAVKVFQSAEFKTNPLLVRIVAATNKMVEDYNETIRYELFGVTAAAYEKGELLMGYNSFGEADKAGVTAIANGIDYIVQSASEPVTSTILGVPMQTSRVTIEDVYSKKISTVSIVLPTNSIESFQNLAKELESLETRAKKGERHLWRQFFAVKETWVFPRNIMRPGSSTQTLIAKTIDYGYSHTIHKSQGGTYKYIFVDDPSINVFPEKEQRRLRYVGLTRAESGAFVYTTEALVEPAKQKAAPEENIEQEQETTAENPDEEVADEAAPVEGRVENPQTMEEAFPGIAPQLGAVSETLTLQQKYQRLNKFLSGFKLLVKSSALYARMTNVQEELITAIQEAWEQKSPSKIMKLFVPEYQYMQPNELQVEALRELIASFVPEVVDTLNRELWYRVNSKATPQSRSIIENLLAPEEAEAVFYERQKARIEQAKKNGKVIEPTEYTAEWEHTTRLSLHVMEWGLDAKGVPYFRYQPQVAEAMALSTLHWALSNVNNPTNPKMEKLLRIHPEGLSPELLQAYKTSHAINQPVQTIARNIMEILGVSAKSDLSKTFANGIPKALAQDAIHAMSLLGVFEINKIDGTKETRVSNSGIQQYNTYRFIKFNKNPNINAWGNIQRNKDKSFRVNKYGEIYTPVSVKNMADRLEGNSLLTRLLLPATQEQPYFGEPTKVIQTRVAGGSQAVSETQRKALRNENNTPFQANMPLVNFLNVFGEDNYLKLRGFREDIPLNEDHARQVEGVNQGLTYAMRGLKEMLVNWQAKAEDMGKASLVEISVFFANRVTSNGRMMQNGPLTPQGSKLIREMVSPIKQVLDLVNNQEHRLAYYLTLAQALGLKTEKLKNIKAVEQIRDMLEWVPPAGSDQVNPFITLFADINQLMEMDPESDETADFAAEVTKQFASIMADKDLRIPKTDRAIHALVTHARYMATKDKSSFETYLAFELDGKTDGPFHAIAQFGFWAANPLRALEQLRKGGWFINQESIGMLSDDATTPDAYKDIANIAQNRIQNGLSQPLGDIARAMLGASVNMMVRIKHFVEEIIPASTDSPPRTKIEVLREHSKNALMTMLYGAGSRTVVGVLAYDIFNLANEMMSEALEDSDGQTRLPVEFQEHLALLMSRVYNPTTKKWYDITPPRLDDIRFYGKGMFNTEHMRALIDNLSVSSGQILTSAVETEMGDVLSTFDLLYKASAFQTWSLKKQYNEAYEILRLQRVAEGKLGPKNALSAADERAVMEGLADQVPAYALSITGSGAEGEGINVSESGSGKIVINGEVQQADSLLGEFKIDIDGKQVINPGVRGASMTIIGSGDATMMTGFQVVTSPKTEPTLKVFDGLETGPFNIRKHAQQINQAVFNAVHFDLLGSIDKTFSGMILDIGSLSNDEITELAAFVRLENSFKMSVFEKREALIVLLGYTAKTIKQRAQSTRINKKISKTLNNNMDHMSGGENPHTVNNPIQPDVADYFAKMRAQLYAEEAAAAITIAASVAAVVAGQNAARAKVTGQPVIEEEQEGDELQALIPAAVTAAEPEVTTPVSTVKKVTRSELFTMLKIKGFTNPVREFVYKKIIHLLPENLTVYFGTKEQLLAKAYEIFPDKPAGFFSETARAWYFNGTVFMTNRKEESLIHELVHAATYQTLLTFYNKGAKGLSFAQKEGIRALDILAHEFAVIEMPELAVDAERLEEIRADFLQAQAIVRELLQNGDMAEGVNEFMAWVMTNTNVQSALSIAAGSVALKGLRNLAKKIIKLVRGILGLPKNDTMETFMAQAMGSFERLVRQPNSSLDVSNIELPLNHAMGSPPATGLQGARLQELADQFEWMRMHLPKDGRSVLKIMQRGIDALPEADRIRQKFVDAGFNFTAQEQFVFEQLQALFASTITLDASTFIALQNIYNDVMPQLSAEDFLDDPLNNGQIQMSEAAARFNALKGVGTSSKDKLGRSNDLANFIALALVHSPLRTKMSKMVAPKGKIEGKNMDQKLRSATTLIFDKLNDTATLHNQSHNQREAIDLLMARLYKNQQIAVKRAGLAPSMFEKTESKVKEGISFVADKAEQLMFDRQAAGKMGGVDGIINFGLNAVRAMGSEAGSAAFAEGAQQAINESGLWRPIAELLGDLVGLTDSSYPIALHLNQVKNVVSRARQRMRDEIPPQVRGLFATPLTKEAWKTLHRVVGEIDLRAVFGAFSGSDLQGLLRDPGQLTAAADAIEGQLGTNALTYAQAAKDLAHYQTTGTNIAEGFLWRNPEAMALMAGTGVQISSAEFQRLVPLLDRLTTLRALEGLQEAERVFLADLTQDNQLGMESLLRLMRAINAAEFRKPDYQAQALNRWKGYIPKSFDPRDALVLANPTQGVELLKQGYRRLEAYQGDPLDPSAANLHYYAVTWSGGKSSYNQGAMQTVEGSVGGVDRLTGRTLNSSVQTMITDPGTVQAITDAKRLGGSTGQHNLLPVFDSNGEVYAYERVLDRALLERHQTGHVDLSESIGMWMGRQVEEDIARIANKKLTQVLKKIWDKGVAAGRSSEFVDVADSNSKTIQEAWNSIPRETQDMLTDTFGNQVMVRKDMLNSALGNRSASVADVFTGLTDLPESTQKFIVDAAYGLLGKDAYKRLVVLERTWQSVVGLAKNIIIVRSGTLALANGIANQFQLVAMGVPPNRLLQDQIAKAREAEIYFRNEKQLAELEFEKATANRPDVLSSINRQIRVLKDINTKLSIWPLIEAGELSTISEGLNEQDEYTILNDFTGWLEEKTKNLPAGLTTAAKYAIISKDTAIYQGLNRAIQLGDFMAKAVSYDLFISQGMSQKQALKKVNESFVNYNLPLGRGHDYAENMGLIWFSKYTIRIQKIIMRTLRDNPLRFLMSGLGADWAGADYLVDSSLAMKSWGWSLGPGQVFRAHDALMWKQLNPL